MSAFLAALRAERDRLRASLAAVDACLACYEAVPVVTPPIPAPVAAKAPPAMKTQAQAPAPKSKPPRGPVYTEARNELLRRDYPDPSVSTAELFRRCNALPGPPIASEGALAKQALVLKLSRPRKSAPAAPALNGTHAPLIVRQVEIDAWARQVDMTGHKLPAINAARAKRGLAPFTEIGA